jgi:gluconolactonase
VTAALRRRHVALVGLAAVVAGGAAIGLSIGGSTQPRAGPIAASYPEGPLSQGDRLYYAEMGADRVSVVEDGDPRPFFTQRGCGPTAIAPYGDEGYLVLCHIGRRAVAVSRGGAETRRWVADADGNALMDPNDASADGRGGVYLSDPGAFSRHTEPHGRILHLGADGVLRIVADTLWYPNGVYVDQVHRHLYVCEHLAGRVLRFEIRRNGSLGPAVTFARVSDAVRSDRYDTPYGEAGPDGLEIGPNGELYVAVYGEGRVLRFARDGAYRGAIELPTRYATNITFLPDGRAATTGAFDNVAPPFPGEVRFHAAEDLTTAPD